MAHQLRRPQDRQVLAVREVDLKRPLVEAIPTACAASPARSNGGCTEGCNRKVKQIKRYRLAGPLGRLSGALAEGVHSAAGGAAHTGC